MRDGNKQSVITKLKREIIRLLYSNPDIIEILDNPEVDPECPDTAEWICILPYIKVEKVQQETRAYIGVAIDSDGPIENDNFQMLRVNVTTFCPLRTMRVAGQKGTRTDILGGDICETLNWNRSLGFELRVVGEQEGVMSSNDYYFRTLYFEAVRENNLVGGRKNRH